MYQSSISNVTPSPNHPLPHPAEFTVNIEPVLARRPPRPCCGIYCSIVKVSCDYRSDSVAFAIPITLCAERSPAFLGLTQQTCVATNDLGRSTKFPPIRTLPYLPPSSRVRRRHMSTGLGEEEARARVEGNDLPNARLVSEKCPWSEVDVVIDSL